MLIVKYLLLSMIYGFVIAGLKDAFPPIKKRIDIMFKDFSLLPFNKKTRDGDQGQQRRASCWTNAPLTSPTKV